VASDFFNPQMLGRCPSCDDAVYRVDERWEVTREGESHPPMGTSVHYHKDCAPFGATSIPDEIEKQAGRRQRGAEMRQKLAEGPDAE